LRKRIAFLALFQPVFLPAQTPDRMTAPDIEAFLDGLTPIELHRQDIAGAVIAIVKDGKVLFAKGYGYADVEKRKPVLPDGTLFRPGSISKLFTWTAVMQLMEQGKLDLDRDVNEYLDFRIPAAYARPITLRNIMTHTPGFEESFKELFIRDVKDLKPLNEYLKERLPQRIFPPGTTPAYSNYATALAGEIVQRVSGVPFEVYIEEHILKPLGMAHTTFRQPLPEPLKPFMSSGYILGSQPAKLFEVVQPWPAGSCSTTGLDVARFMIAHLQDGRYEGAQILRPETARLMHSRQYATDPRLNGMALGFYEETRNEHRIIGHGGDTIYFHSDLHLMPDRGLGFFYSQNSAGKGAIRSAVWEAFLDRYFPYREPEANAVATAKEDARLVSGHYITSRRSETNLLTAGTLAGELTVYPNRDGTISGSLFRDLNGQPRRFREVGPLLFREVDGQSLLAFHRDAAGRLILGIGYPFMVFQRTYWHQDLVLNLAILGVSLAVLALVVIAWPLGALVRWHYGRKLSLSPAERRLWILVRLVCIVDLVFAASWLVLASAFDDPTILSSRLDPWQRLIQSIGWLAATAAVIPLYNVLKSWTAAGRWWFSKIADSAVALACAGLVWFIFNWNMLHWSLNY